MKKIQLYLDMFIKGGAILLLLVISTDTQGQQSKPKKRDVSFEYRFADDLKQTPDSEARLDQWFADAKFGAFIHFGVYSML